MAASAPSARRGRSAACRRTARTAWAAWATAPRSSSSTSARARRGTCAASTMPCSYASDNACRDCRRAAQLQHRRREERFGEDCRDCGCFSVAVVYLCLVEPSADPWCLFRDSIAMCCRKQTRTAVSCAPMASGEYMCRATGDHVPPVSPVNQLFSRHLHTASYWSTTLLTSPCGVCGAALAAVASARRARRTATARRATPC